MIARVAEAFVLLVIVAVGCLVVSDWRMVIDFTLASMAVLGALATRGALSKVGVAERALRDIAEGGTFAQYTAERALREIQGDR